MANRESTMRLNVRMYCIIRKMLRDTMDLPLMFTLRSEVMGAERA